MRVSPQQGRGVDQPRSIEQQLAGLSKLSLSELRTLCRRVASTPVPPTRSEVELLVRCHLQQRLISKLRSKMTQAAIAAEAMLSVLDSDSRDTEILRAWNGRIYSVTVVDGGVIYEGDRYRSLDAVAKKVTGKARYGAQFFSAPAERNSP